MPRPRKLRLKERRRRTFYILSILGFTLLFGAVAGGIFALQESEINISTVTVSGANFTREDLVRQMIEGMLEGSYFFVVPRTNTLLYPKSAITRDLYSLFPAVKEVTFEKISFTELNIALAERDPSALWCSSLSSTSPCYLMDEDGLVFFKADIPDDTLVIYSGELVGEPLSSVFLSGDYHRLDEFIKNVSVATGLKPHAIVVQKPDDILISFEGGGELRFTQKNANDALLDNIVSVFASQRLSSNNTLEYADFRFGNKIYVKFREE